MSEVAGNYKNSLASLITPHATKTSLDQLPYDVRVSAREPYHAALPEHVVSNLVRQIRTLSQRPNMLPNSIQDELIKHFLSKCGEKKAIMVAASIIAHNTGAYYSLEGIGTKSRLPFNFDSEFQRKLLRASAQFEHDKLQQGLTRQLEENPEWDGIPKIKEELKSLEEFLKKIDEREGKSVTPGELA